MRYTSTRDSSISVSFEVALCSGYAPDGGLFVPCKLPTIGVDSHLKPWSKLTYPELAGRVIRMFISKEEVSDNDLDAICKASFVGFDDSDNAVPVRRVGSAFVAELFHGPTFCFKDLGMRAVVNLLSHFSTLRKRRTTLLVATTGDTGPAAVRAVSDAANPLLTILVHYPLGQISNFQRRQLTTIMSTRVQIVAFEGGGDDMDAPIKNIQASPNSFLTGEGDTPPRMICGVNSYNIGRPLVQMIHFIWVYLRVIEQLNMEPGAVVDVVVPTGAMGNVAGGYMAKKMGLPLGLLCAGVNVNDITHRAIQNGEFHRSERMEKTLSEAINIQVPYNFERLIYYLTGEDHEVVREWMITMDKTNKLDLDDKWLAELQKEFDSARVTDEEMCTALKSVKDAYSYTIDPHTAVAVSTAEKLGYRLADPQSTPVAILATASPCKFEESVTVAIGKEGWDDYVQANPSLFDIMKKEEVEPTIYRWKEGAELAEVQQEWEQMARDIIKKELN